MIKSMSLYAFVPAILSFMVGFVKIFGTYASFSFLIHVLNSTILVTGATLRFSLK